MNLQFVVDPLKSYTTHPAGILEILRVVLSYLV